LSILVCGSYGNIIRVLAPFVITDEQLNKGLDIMEAGIKKISA
jgi:4-aminobutyrate aminotransferase/(S)-3-amino-2-methylpropionate transaminase